MRTALPKLAQAVNRGCEMVILVALVRSAFAIAAILSAPRHRPCCWPVLAILPYVMESKPYPKSTIVAPPRNAAGVLLAISNHRQS
jgi:hypothetical protein